MQAIAPDFSAVFNNKTAARGDERAGDKLFDSLLREEEAHYAREPQPPREPREAARRDEPETRVDDARRDDPDEAAVDDEHHVEEATAAPAPDKTPRHDDAEVEAQAPAEPAPPTPQHAAQPTAVGQPAASYANGTASSP